MQPLPSISEDEVVVVRTAETGAGAVAEEAAAVEFTVAEALLSAPLTTGLAAFLFLGWS